MTKVTQVLEKIGLNDKGISVYQSLLTLGPSPVRKIAAAAGVNRGTTYDILRSLQEQGLVSYYHKEKHQYFVAEDPKKLFDVVHHRIDTFEKLKKDLHEIVPQLRSVTAVVEDQPIVTFYDGALGVRSILLDVLTQTELTEGRAYHAYSSPAVSKYVYAAYPDFSQDRMARNISVKVIALGKGGELVGLDERKWIKTNQAGPAYTFIYADRVAMISTNRVGVPIGLIIQNKDLSEMQRIVFEQLWACL